MTDRKRRPDLTFPEFLDERQRMIRALELIADAVEAMPDAPEAVRAIGIVARSALGE